MKGEMRRATILQLLSESEAPVSATALARKLGVSRQRVVDDVALLRAGGAEIVATARGYLSGGDHGRLRRTVACCHDAAGMARELEIMVDQGCYVQDVIVEHPIYGQLTGNLDIRSRYDVAQFISRALAEEAKPLSMLTQGLHLHTLLCPDEAAFERVQQALREAGFLLLDNAPVGD